MQKVPTKLRRSFESFETLTVSFVLPVINTVTIAQMYSDWNQSHQTPNNHSVLP